jgi:Yip1 domain
MRSITLLFKVLWSPGEAMSFIARNPRWILPVSLLICSSLAGAAIVKSKLPDLPMRVIERSATGRNLSDDVKDNMRRQADSPAAWIFTLIFSGIRPVLLLVTVSAIYFSIFTIIGREGTFKSFFSITAFAFLPMIFRQIATALTAFFVPSSSVMPDELGSLSPAVFLDRDAVSALVFSATNMIDVVSIWTLSLMIIGYAFVARKSLSRATRGGVVLGVFLFYALARILIRIV